MLEVHFSGDVEVQCSSAEMAEVQGSLTTIAELQATLAVVAEVQNSTEVRHDTSKCVTHLVLSKVCPEYKAVPHVYSYSGARGAYGTGYYV